MAVDQAPSKRVLRLAEDMQKTIFAKKALIDEAEGKITFEVYQKGEGFDIKVTITSR